jgi:hypothetical protein
MTAKNIIISCILFINILLPLLFVAIGDVFPFSILIIMPMLFMFLGLTLYFGLLIYGFICKDIRIIIITTLGLLVYFNIRLIPFIGHYSSFYFNIGLADAGYQFTPMEYYLGYIISYYQSVIVWNILLFYCLSKLPFNSALEVQNSGDSKERT